MTTISVTIPVLNQPGSTQLAFNSLKALQKNKNQYIIVDNGSNPPVREWLKGLEETDIIIRNESNKGLPVALNQALSVNRADYMLATHSDIQMFEQDWDEKTAMAIDEANKTKPVGVAGYFGALGIGSPDIYRSPYSMQQLARQYPIAGDRCKLDPLVHNQSQFGEMWKKCAVLDGFSLIVRKDLRFWDKSVHHCYDNQICLDSINLGNQNIVINMDINHFGGRTDVGEDWASPFGKTKQQVHEESHIPFYEEWKPGNKNITLPYFVN